MKDDMLALAARVEALDGADREVDGLVELSCGPDAPAIQRIMAGSIHNTIGEVAKAADREGGRTLFRIPRYTASMDAVLSLVDKGDEWSISTLYCIARAEVGINRDQQTSWTGYGEHAGCNPVLAFLAAALRARASMGGE